MKALLELAPLLAVALSLRQLLYLPLFVSNDAKNVDCFMQSCTGLWGTATPVEQCERTIKPAIILFAAMWTGVTEGKGILQDFDKF